MREIRLKEPRPSVRDFLTPSDEYREGCDDTLAPGPFRRRNTDDGFLATGNDRFDAPKRLVLLGGSFVESMYTDEKQRFPSLIERDLPDEWRVCNGGYSGMTSLHLLNVLASKIPSILTPGSKVVLFIGMSDVDALMRRGLYWDSEARITPVIPAPSPREVSLAPVDAARGVIRSVVDVAVNLGMDFGVVASPYRKAGLDDEVVARLHSGSDARYRDREEARRVVQETAREEAARAGVPFFDSQRHCDPSDFYDMFHLNELGQVMYAAAIDSWLRTDMGIGWGGSR